MDRILAVICFLMGLAIIIFAFPEGGVAFLVTAVGAAIVIFIIRKQLPEEKVLLTRIFLIALLARIGFGLISHIFELRNFFGGDAETYDAYGYEVVKMWFDLPFRELTDEKLNYRLSGVGWGMLYLVAGLYSVIGRNILAAQFFCAVIGAAIAPMIYTCAFTIFKNRRVGLVAAILVAVYPAFIIWTGQLMKDGLIIFLLVLAMTMVINLQKNFSYTSLALLLFAMFGIISLRFYVFYMVAAAVVGTFVIGFSNSPQAIFRRVVVLMVLGVGLTYMGVIRYAGTEFEKYGDIELIQNSREDLANRAESSYASETDITTTQGAIQAIPIGFIYLMLAPFPWQVTNFRQMITLPDMLIWWCSIPFLISGIGYTIRNHLRGSLGILIFSLMLSFAYSIFQTNVGTAYRQRTQIQVFLFIFVGVGWTLYLERRENEKTLRIARKNELEKRLKENAINKLPPINKESAI